MPELEEWEGAETPAAVAAKPAKGKKAAAEVVDTDLVERTALQIYLNLSQGAMRGYKAEFIADRALQEARVFAAALAKARIGESLVPQEDDGLDWASAPNLPSDHPFNMRSKRYGSAKTLAAYNTLAADEKKFKAALQNLGPGRN